MVSCGMHFLHQIFGRLWQATDASLDAIIIDVHQSVSIPYLGNFHAKFIIACYEQTLPKIEGDQDFSATDQDRDLKNIFHLILKYIQVTKSK